MISLGPRIDRKMTICSSYHGHYFNSLRAAAQIKRALKDFVCVCLLAARAAAWLCADPACSLILSLFSSPPLPAPGCNSGIDGTASLREAGPSSALLTSAPLPPPRPPHPPALTPPCFHNMHFSRLSCYDAHTSFLPQMPGRTLSVADIIPPPCQKGRGASRRLSNREAFSPRIA